jgi:Tfp pilus assembly protein PilX
MRFPNFNLKARQQGAATLFVVMMLAIIMAVISLTTARTGLMEQKVTGNDLRAREVQEAAEAGLEYGIGWAKHNSLPNTVTCSSGSLPLGCPTALTTVTGSSTGESYFYTLTYTKGIDSIKITSTAQGVNDGSIADLGSLC